MRDWEVWTLIPALMLFTLVFFLAFENYSIQEWILGNGIISLGIGFVYISEGIYNGIKRKFKRI